MFNHESPRRAHFVTERLQSGWEDSKDPNYILYMGNIDSLRDWDMRKILYMYVILQQDKPDDYVLATGDNIPFENLLKKF